MYARQQQSQLAPWRIFFALIALSLCVREGWADALTQWVHEQWQTDRGLPQNSVYCFAQDKTGFLWFGTDGGLVRYDGVQFKIFNQQSTPRVRHNFVSSLLISQDGSFWAGTRTGGLVRYRDNLLASVEELSNEKIFALVESGDGAVWAGSEGALLRFNGAEKLRFGAAEGLPKKDITALCRGKEGSLWVGCGNGEFGLFRDGKFTVVPHQQTLRETAVSALAENPRTGEVWIAHDGGGLFRFDGKTVMHVELTGREVENLFTLMVDHEGTVWTGTQFDGVLRLKEGAVSKYGAEEGLGVGHVLSLFEDRQNSIWVGTLFGGLHRIDKGPVMNFGQKEGLANEALTCVLEVEPGVLWIGARNSGVTRFVAQGKFEPVVLPQLPRDVRAMLRSRDGSIWIGGKEGGILRVQGDTRTHFGLEDGLLANDTSVLYETASGEVWAGSQRSGITVFDPIRNRVARTYSQSPVMQHVRCIAEDKEGTFWIGTQQGLVRFKDGHFQPRYLLGLEDASIRSIYVDDRNVLWIGTRDDSLVRLSNEGMFMFDSARGITHVRIYQLFARGEDLWIAGNRGIECVSFAELNKVATGEAPRVFSRLLTERDGLRTVECSSDTSPSIAMSSEGLLWFGTRRGLARVDPEMIVKQMPAPRPVVTSVRVDQSWIAANSFSTVPAGATRLQFSYAAPELRRGGDILYCYKLQGVDKDWVEAGKEREVIYSSLKPGQYKFSVCASNPQGAWGKGDATLAFAVEPRFYQTAWFFALCLVGGAGGIFELYRWRVAGIQRRNEKLQQLVRERTCELEEEVAQRKRAEEQQIALNVDLEARVVARTSELTHAYVNLQEELRERERIEQELAASEARLRRVVDSGMVGILFWNKDGRIIDANDTFLRMIGYSRDELRRGELRWQAITPSEYAPLDQAALIEIERSGVCTPFEKEYLRKDGTRVPVVLGGACLDRIVEEGVCFVLDISERKASEEEVRRLAQSLEARVQERTLELAHINEQLATEVQERKRVAVALSAFSQLGQKLHAARTEKEAANIIALTAKSLIPHDLCTIELYGPDNHLYPVIRSFSDARADQEPMGSTVSVPIRNGSRVIGVIGVQSNTADALNIADANTLQALGDYCGGALDRIHAEEARRETERRFSAFMANAPALAWMKDSRLRYVFSNPMFQEFLGRSAEQIEEKSDNDLWPESTAARIRNNDLRVLEAEQTLETQETFRRADEESRTLLTLRFPFTTATGERFVAGMAVDITEQKRAEEVLHRLPQSILEAQEQERRRLARELHDSVNQVIASAKFRIQTAENQIMRGDPKWQESCGKSKEMLDLVLKQVRRLSHNLRPGELDDLGLVPAVRTALREFQDRTGIAVHFSALGLEERREATIESTLYRIIQEALTNIEKHSSATSAEVSLNDSAAGLTLEIADNGIGIDPGQSQRGRDGLGLVHMRERAGLVGGTFSLETQPGEGVRIRIQIPPVLQPVFNV